MKKLILATFIAQTLFADPELYFIEPKDGSEQAGPVVIKCG